MNRYHRWLAAGGLLAVALALLAGAALATVVPDDALVALLGNDYLLVAGIGGVALVAALATAASGRPASLRQASVPDPECAVAVPAAGEEFDRVLGRRWTLAGLRIDGRHRTMHARLRTAAIGTVARVECCDREAARARVDAGEWTADPVVAAFLGEESLPRPTLRERLGSLRRGETWFQHRARRAAEEVLALGDGGP